LGKNSGQHLSGEDKVVYSGGNSFDVTVGVLHSVKKPSGESMTASIHGSICGASVSKSLEVRERARIGPIFDRIFIESNWPDNVVVRGWIGSCKSGKVAVAGGKMAVSGQFQVILAGFW
jgi:hypothetical protein